MRTQSTSVFDGTHSTKAAIGHSYGIYIIHIYTVLCQICNESTYNEVTI